MPHKMNRSDFLRFCLAGAGAMACGCSIRQSFGNDIFITEPGPPVPQRSGLWKWSREMSYYIPTPRGLKCGICPNACVLTEGGPESICKNKVVKGEKLYTIAYGNPCAVHVDPIMKKPLYHYHPEYTCYSIATAGCNFACLNCQNWEISQTSPKLTRNEDLMPVDVLRECVDAGCESIAYTYSEPIAYYEYVKDTARLARARGLKNIFISNGYINEKPLREICKSLDAANINLKSFSDEIYAKLNAGTLQPVLNTLRIMKEEGVWLEITNLIVPTWTDKPDMIRMMCEWLAANGFTDTPLHFNRFFPLYKLTSLPYTPLQVLEEARTIAMKAGMKYVYVGNVPNTTSINTICPKCKRTIIERKGFTVTASKLKNGNCGYCGTAIAGAWDA